jgi:tight adherence protein C
MFAGIDDGTLIIVAAAIGAFVVTLALAGATTKPDRLGARVRAVSEGERRGRRRRSGDEEVVRNQALIEWMRSITRRFNLLGSEQSRLTSEKLARAGLRSRDALVIYLFARLIAPFAGGAIGAVLLYGLHFGHLSPLINLAAVIGCVLVGSLMPGIYLRNITERRQALLRKGLPDALDLMVICTEAGQSLDATIGRISTEIGKAWPELADEFNLLSFELGFLTNRKDAFDNFKKRVNLPTVSALCGTLEQTERFGTPLANALRVLTRELRNDRMMRAEERAARLPALMTMPLIVFILPALFVVVMGPAVLKIVDAMSHMGHH